MADLTKRASKGGKARAESLTPEERSESARRAVNARWAKARGDGPTVVVTASSSDVPEIERMHFEVVISHGEPQSEFTEESSWSAISFSSATMLHGIQSYTQ